jgi:hypothetical protein
MRQCRTKWPSGRFLSGRFQLFLLHDEELMFPCLTAAALIVGFDNFAGN